LGTHYIYQRNPSGNDNRQRREDYVKGILWQP
jgi:hypothetical protein